MDHKDRRDEARGAEDAIRPARPGGERKREGETDQRPDPANAVPRTANPSPAEDARAAGTIDDPTAAGDGSGSNDDQAGDRAELAAQRGGQVDVSRDLPKRR
ncbi:hypothetical protein [Falsiroseomonas oryzae]|uniref:hypothetical protein n=1 Tax=Falsiroseomonas oryzae TaxID=2766473 RepID=UPI0022EAA822|nr:hypothetical protein [Roseomonas sp. MO-31]